MTLLEIPKPEKSFESFKVYGWTSFCFRFWTLNFEIFEKKEIDTRIDQSFIDIEM